MENEIMKIIGEMQAIRSLLRKSRLSFNVIKGLNKEIEMRKEMLSGTEEFN